jgi:hypothetical protein
MSKWGAVRDYFRGQFGIIVERRHFIADMALDFPGTNPASAETYRAYLSRAGYLKSVSPGKYWVVRKIPKGLTLSRAIEEAYGKKGKA